MIMWHPGNVGTVHSTDLWRPLHKWQVTSLNQPWGDLRLPGGLELPRALRQQHRQLEDCNLREQETPLEIQAGLWGLFHLLLHHISTFAFHLNCEFHPSTPLTHRQEQHWAISAALSRFTLWFPAYMASNEHQRACCELTARELPNPWWTKT